MQINVPALIKKYGLISDQVDASELTVILTELIKTTADGAIVEFGCYRGTTSLYIRRVLNLLALDGPFHVYDSFAGLPEKAQQDSSPAGLQFIAGELAVSKKEFYAEFKKAGLHAPIVHKGWFNELTDSDVPENIAFAFLDGDYYDSIKSSLALIEKKLVPGAVIVVDDYANEALPGAARAVNEWLRGRAAKIQVIHSLAVVHLSF